MAYGGCSGRRTRGERAVGADRGDQQPVDTLSSDRCDESLGDRIPRRPGPTHDDPIPLSAWKARQTNPDTLVLLDQLLDENTDAETATELNHTASRSGIGKPFTAAIVLHLRRASNLPSHAQRLHARGLLTTKEIAKQLDVHTSTIKAWHDAGLLKSEKANERLYHPPEPGDPRLVKHLGGHLTDREPTQPSIPKRCTMKPKRLPEVPRWVCG